MSNSSFMPRFKTTGSFNRDNQSILWTASLDIFIFKMFELKILIKTQQQPLS